MHMCWSDLNCFVQQCTTSPLQLSLKSLWTPNLKPPLSELILVTLQCNKIKGSLLFVLRYVYIVLCTSSTYGVHQVSDDDKPTQTILSDMQKKFSNVNSIPHTAELGVNAFSHANTAMADLDIITSRYLHPLKTIITVVDGIANISFVA